MKKVVSLILTGLLAIANGTYAQDHLIENQRKVFIIDNTDWGNTYVGAYTSSNRLYLTNGVQLTSDNAYVGFSASASNNYVFINQSNATWQVDSLNIGSTNNGGNIVEISNFGTLKVVNGLSIAGAANTNGLLLIDDGILHIQSDFDASMEGFAYSNATLKVGGKLTGIDRVFNGMSVVLSGEDNGTNATWNVGSGLLSLGGIDDNNRITLEHGSLLSTSNLWIGTTNTSGNIFTIDSDARAHIQNSISILGSDNTLQVTDGGVLEVDMDFNTEMTGFELQTGGGLEAHRNLTMDAISNGVHVALDGTNALWNRSGLAINIGSSTNHSGNSLTIREGAHAYANQLNLGEFSNGNLLTITNNGVVQLDQILIGGTNTQNNAVLLANGGTLVLEGNGSFINAFNTLTLVQGGRLTIKNDFGSSLDWDEDANFIWGNGGILEVQGAAPIFTRHTINGQYIEYGTLFLRDGQILMLNGSNAKWDSAAHNLHIGDLSSGNALIITNGAYAEVKTMTIGDFKEGGNNNLILISGEQSEIYSAGDIELGGRYLGGEWFEGGSNNIIRIQDGGRLSTDGAFRIGGNNNRFSFSGETSELSVAGGMAFYGTGITLDLSEGASITNSSSISMVGDKHKILMDGSNTLFTTTDNIVLNGSDLMLGLTDGASLTNGGVFSMSGDSNSILISGPSSSLSASGDIDLTGSDILAEIANGASLSSGGTLYNAGTNGISGLKIGIGSTVSASNYKQTKESFLRFELNNSPTNMGILQVTDTAEFEKGAEIGFYTKASDLAFDAIYTNTLVEASQLVAGGITNPTTVELSETLDLDQSRGLVDYEILVQTNGGNHDIIVLLDRTLIGRSAGFDPDSMMWNVAGTIDALSLNSNNTAAINQVNILNGMTSAQQNQQLTQLYATSLPVYMHNSGVLRGIDQTRARGATFRGMPNTTPAAKPTGVSGPSPHSGEQGLQGWVKAYGALGNRDSDDSTGLADGYSMNAFGTVVGFDRSFSQWLFGIAGGYAHSGLKGDNDDTSNATTGYGVLYTTYGTNTWFVDFAASFGVSSIENASGTAFDATSDTTAQQSVLYLGLGYEFDDKDSAAKLRPLMGAQFHNFSQDAYTYSLMNVDAYDRQSIQSIIGTSMMIPKAGTKVDWESDFRVFWLHEFNDDVDSLSYTMAGPGTPGQMIIRSPDSDIGQFGVGLTANWRNGWQAKLDLDGQVSKTFYSATISGAILREF